MQLVEWWNLPFTVPFALAILYLLLTSAGLVELGTETPDASVDATSGTDGDAGGGDGGHAAYAEPVPSPGDLPGLQPEHHAGSTSRTLDFLGLGRVPLAIVIQIFFLVWGFAGWAATLVLRPLLGAPLLFFPLALAVAAVCAIAATVLLARPLARWLPSTESHAPTKRDLAGRVGTVVFAVTPASGVIQVRDDHGNLHQVPCRLNGHSGHPVGTDPPPILPLPKGSEVIVVSYEEDTDRYLVVPSDLPALPRR